MSLFDELKTLQDVQRLIDDGVREGDTIDYKRADAPLQDRAPVAKVVCAFANANGGVCIYGVETTKAGRPRAAGAHRADRPLPTSHGSGRRLPRTLGIPFPAFAFAPSRMVACLRSCWWMCPRVRWLPT